MKPTANEAQPPRTVARRAGSLLGITCLAAGMVYTTGCRQQMADMPFQKPYAQNHFFKDQAASRELPAGTVARGQVTNTTLAAGKVGDKEVDFVPFPVTKEFLLRGQQRYDIYCAPCHGTSGNGEGMVAASFVVKPPTYHDERLRKVPVGHFVNVITNGFNSMYNYANRVDVQDRWAIAAYIRALQLSQNAQAADLPPAELAKLQGSPK